MGKMDIFWVGRKNGSDDHYVAPYAVWGKHSERWGSFLFWKSNNGNGPLLVVGSRKLTESCPTKHEALAKLYHRFQEHGNGNVPDCLPDNGGNRKGAIRTSIAKEMAEFNLNLLTISIPDERTLFSISMLSGIRCADISVF